MTASVRHSSAHRLRHAKKYFNGVATFQERKMLWPPVRHETATEESERIAIAAKLNVIVMAFFKAGYEERGLAVPMILTNVKNSSWCRRSKVSKKR